MNSAPKIELIYDRDCPNVDAARDAIRGALAELGVSVSWQEWDRGAEATPSVLRNLGSPTVLLDGKDVASESGELAQADANCCRVYLEDGSITGAPSAAMIVNAIKRARRTDRKGVH